MKERMVTRTIETIEVCALYCNTEAMTMGECYLSLPGNTPESKLDKYARAAFAARPAYRDNPTVAFVAIKSWHKESELYGMTETDFLRYATHLPPR